MSIRLRKRVSSAYAALSSAHSEGVRMAGVVA
jgi:hypothetical protein